MDDIAKVFMTGRSQAVRLPKAFRFATDTVRIRKEGNAVVLEPLEAGWDWLDRIGGPFDADFLKAVAETPREQVRPDLDCL